MGNPVPPWGSPMNDAVPPWRNNVGTSSIDARAPDASNTLSTLRRFVSSPMVCRASSGCREIAPSAVACWRRFSTGSMANTSAAPFTKANSTPNKPIGPSPTMATRSPGVMSARVTPKCAVASASVSNTAWSSLTPSGIFIRVTSALGTCTYSAWHP